MIERRALMGSGQLRRAGIRDGETDSERTALVGKAQGGIVEGSPEIRR